MEAEWLCSIFESAAIYEFYTHLKWCKVKNMARWLSRNTHTLELSTETSTSKFSVITPSL